MLLDPMSFHLYGTKQVMNNKLHVQNCELAQWTFKITPKILCSKLSSSNSIIAFIDLKYLVRLATDGVSYQLKRKFQCFERPHPKMFPKPSTCTISITTLMYHTESNCIFYCCKGSVFPRNQTVVSILQCTKEQCLGRKFAKERERDILRRLNKIGGTRWLSKHDALLGLINPERNQYIHLPDVLRYIHSQLSSTTETRS